MQDFGEPIETNAPPQVVSRYIPNPLLLHRRKFDLRIYVLVTSFEPLPTVYVYREGLVRFASKEFDMKNLKNRKQHLTNYSINKSSVQVAPERRSPQNAYDLFSSQSSRQAQADEQFDPFRSCKWKLSALLTYLSSLSLDTSFLLQQMHVQIVKTLLSGEKKISQFLKAKSQRGGYFELFGFDILLDDNLKPWVLEVNMTPSLVCDSELDFAIKAPLVADALSIAGVKTASNQRTIMLKESVQRGQQNNYFNSI